MSETEKKLYIVTIELTKVYRVKEARELVKRELGVGEYIWRKYHKSKIPWNRSYGWPNIRGIDLYWYLKECIQRDNGGNQHQKPR